MSADDIPTAEASAWLKRTRVAKGWSTTRLANEARALARASGSQMALTQQTVSGFEQPGAKRIPEWFRFAKEALESDSPPALPSEQPVPRSVDGGEIVEIIQLDLSVAMGPGVMIDDFVQSEAVSFDLAQLRRLTRTDSDRLRFITGIGTSHEPKFQSGDQFLIDINDRKLTRIDGYYWISFDGAHALKRLRPLGNGMIQVISENPDYGPMDLEAKAVRIEGRAIWFARGL